MGSELIRRGTLAALIVAACTSTALACLWDRDTIRAEAKGLPGIVDIITGRFDHFPPLYYEMRLKRVAAELESDPTNLALYDDAAVACDRLGQGDNAIEWMAKKKSQLDQLDPADSETRDHLYRYYANLGTFHTHDWLRSGANKADMTSLQMGRDFIQAAIDLNPDAHFGRERYQLMAIQWLLDGPVVDDLGYRLPSFLDHLVESPQQLAHGYVSHLANAGYDDAIDGIAGLIVLGEAWASLDVFYALGLALSDHGDASIAYLVGLRCTELVKEGELSLVADQITRDRIEASIHMLGDSAQDLDTLDEYFNKARTASKERHKSRSEYMLARLESGEHPDTHANFWVDYREHRPVSLPNGFLGTVGTQKFITIAAMAIVLPGMAIVLLVVGLIAAFRIRRHHRNKRAADPQLST